MLSTSGRSQGETMTSSRPQKSHGIKRRDFLVGAGAGLAASLPLGWLGFRGWQAAGFDGGDRCAFAGTALEDRHSEYAMPGPFPGRVIEVHHPGVVRADHSKDHATVKTVVDRGMRELAGADDAVEAWRRFFEPGDVVGIKVNPVGRKYDLRQAEAISSPPVLLEVVAGLKSAGVKAKDIILFERYAMQFRGAGYEALLRERSMEGVRWYASSVEYEGRQVDIEGHDYCPERDPHVVGYDPDVFVSMGYASPEHDPKDDRRLRSHLSLIVSRMVNKIINIPVLKDHGSAGVTLALKNLSHGLNNNVARSHLAGIGRGRTVSGPNQCNTFIPTAAGQELIRRKATLHILDGLIAVYQGGPSHGLNWHCQSLFFGTDPVAMDHVGWGIIDSKRLAMGRPRVGAMGLHSPVPEGREGEAFDRRQPEHIILAGTIGLGVFDPNQIDHRRIDLLA
jgi:uncharacterized protein (DUF362 family)